MHEERSLLHREGVDLQHAAETHFKLGNYLQAISLLSKAIEIAPSAEKLLLRAEVYWNLQQEDNDNKLFIINKIT